MVRRSAQPDYYAVLQVPPQASSEEIDAAYRRLHELYSPDRMRDAAPEFQARAAEKRQQLVTAWETLSDPDRRAAYDQRNGPAMEAVQEAQAARMPDYAAPLDYRPLPPARGKERERSVEPQVERAPGRRVERAGGRSWLPAIAVGLVALAVLLLIVLSPVRAFSNATAIATPVLANVQTPFTDVQLRQFRASAEATNSFENWAAYGNALFDNLQTLRESAPQTPQYRNSVSDWLVAAQAYEQALALRDDPDVRSDRVLALLNYGLDAPDQQRVAAAISETEQQIRAGVTTPRALINYGLALASINPPRTAEAVALWQRIVADAPDAPEVQTAKVLIDTYTR